MEKQVEPIYMLYTSLIYLVIHKSYKTLCNWKLGVYGCLYA